MNGAEPEPIVGTGGSFDRFTLLLVLLAALLLLGPLVDGVTDPLEVSTILFLALMLALVRALDLHWGVLIFGVTLIACGFLYETAVNRGAVVVVQPAILVITPIAYLLFVGAAIVGLMRVVLSHQSVSAETVRGGVAVYLLLAVVWSLLFEVVALLNPAAFAGAVGGGGVDPAAVRGNFMYFSLTTMTTLGYGDIVPRSAFARNLVTLEAVSGQLFLAVFMARLVGIQIAQELKAR